MGTDLLIKKCEGWDEEGMAMVSCGFAGKAKNTLLGSEQINMLNKQCKDQKIILQVVILVDIYIGFINKCLLGKKNKFIY